MEVILSSAFGLQAESQTNPNDPITKYASKAMTPRPWINILAMIPVLGKKLTKYFIGAVFRDIETVSDRIIKERKLHGVENSASKVSELVNLCTCDLSGAKIVIFWEDSSAFLHR